MPPAMRPIENLLCIASLAALLAACGVPEDESGKRKSLAGEGREETSTIRNAENIGYGGNAIADKVDGALDANDHRVDELNKQLDAAGQAN
ncbi:hypothetical protein DFR24_4884 [Panacagrimonas perspica]|uniref:Lipoprotein n=2 Tax=Panacagrimonas perspica TaxID=381431 RepID=A0A4S3K0I0_9GAMM|nr:hypothetical protein DFR24_4884 [Panacagrimonas perspica]THD01417.1 hypothetical protein B1810_19940 [Panacagrimonas perspica]